MRSLFEAGLEARLRAVLEARLRAVLDRQMEAVAQAFGGAVVRCPACGALVVSGQLVRHADAMGEDHAVISVMES